MKNLQWCSITNWFTHKIQFLGDGQFRYFMGLSTLPNYYQEAEFLWDSSLDHPYVIVLLPVLQWVSLFDDCL
jgi:hypothetical protein